MAGGAEPSASSSPYQSSASGHHPCSSSAEASGNYPVDNSNQNTVYYDPQRDVSVSGATQNATSGAPDVIQPAVGTSNATNAYAPYSNSVQPGYNNAAQYPNYYYNYPQAANDSSVQQGVDPSSDCARICSQQLLLSEQCLGWRKVLEMFTAKHIRLTLHQILQLPRIRVLCPPILSAILNSTTSGLIIMISLHQTPETKASSVASGYAYPSSQPPPPGTTPVAPTVPPMQAAGITGLQSQHANQAPGHQGFQSQHANQAPGVPGSQSQHMNQTPGAPGFQGQHVNQALAPPGFPNKHINQAPGPPGFK